MVGLSMRKKSCLLGAEMARWVGGGGLCVELVGGKNWGTSEAVSVSSEGLF